MSSEAIDIHQHILPPAYVEALGNRLGPQGLFGSLPKWSPAISIEAMDRQRIRTAVTSISAPGVWFGDVSEAVRLARECNEYAASMQQDYPGRFGFFALLPLPDIRAGLAEIEYSLDTLKAAGVTLMTHYDGRYLGDPAFAPIFDELHRREAVVFVHPTSGPYDNPLPHVPIPTLEFPFETTRTVTSLLFGGTLTRCRGASFIFSHAGGAVPFLVHRIARLTRVPAFKRAVPDGVAAELSRVYFDTALSANRSAFDPLYRLVPVSHILFGSDYPHAGEPTLGETLDGLEDLGMSREQVDAVRGINASALLPALEGRIGT